MDGTDQIAGSRRSFLRTGAGAVIAGAVVPALAGEACAPAAAPAPQSPASRGAVSSAPAAWEQEWNRLISGAKQEGKLVVNWIHNRLSPRKHLDEFEAAFPGIAVELTTFASGSLWNPKVLQEMSANIFTWDLALLGTPFGLPLRDANALIPLQPLLFRPDVLDDKGWRNGFAAGWVDKEKRWGYGFLEEISGDFFYNADLANQSEVQRVTDLTNPKWKERMAFSDIRQGGGYTRATAVRLGHGEEMMRRIFVDQKPTYFRDDRAIMEALVRGSHVIGMGASLQKFLEEFQAQGLGKNIKQIFFPDLAFGSIGSIAWALKGAPHPNALKLYLNWLFTKDGQNSYSKSSGNNSRRLDAPPVDPLSAVGPGMKLIYSRGTEATTDEEVKTQKLLLDLIR